MSGNSENTTANEGEQALLDLLEDKARLSLVQHMQADVQQSVVEHKEFPVYAHWMSFVLMASDDFQLVVKTHFNNSDINQLIRKQLRQKDLHISQELFSGFMNEFSNLYSAKIKNCLVDVDLNVGLSLPLMTRGFDNYFFGREKTNTTEDIQKISVSQIYQVSRIWLFTVEERPIFISCDISITAAQVFDKLIQLKQNTIEEHSDSKMEFL